MTGRRMAKCATFSMAVWSICAALIFVGRSSAAVASSDVRVTSAPGTQDGKAAKTSPKSSRRRTSQPAKKARGSLRPPRGRKEKTKTPARTKPVRTTPHATPQPGAQDRAATVTRVPTTEFDIPPAENLVPPEDKTYRFGFLDATYSEMLEGFARQSGLGILGEAPKAGRVNLTVLEPISFKEALSRIRMILFNSSPLDPYWMDRRGSHLVVERLTDLHRGLPEEHMFRSLDALWKADLTDDEMELVIYTPDRPLDQIRQALENEVEPGVVLADAAYGNDSAFRAELQKLKLTQEKQ